MRCQTAAMERSLALQSRVLSLANIISMDFNALPRRVRAVGRQEEQVRPFGPFACRQKNTEIVRRRLLGGT
jgi:hypothetical protein